MWPAIPLCEQFTDLNRSSHSCSKLLLTLHRGVLQQTWISMTSPRSISQHCRGSVIWNTINFCTLNNYQYSFSWGTWWCNWLKHCVTSQKVTDSILDYVIRIFHSHKPTGCIIALGSTQSLTQMSTRNISWWSQRPCTGLAIWPPSCANCLESCGPQPPGTPQAL